MKSKLMVLDEVKGVEPESQAKYELAIGGLSLLLVAVLLLAIALVIGAKDEC